MFWENKSHGKRCVLCSCCLDIWSHLGEVRTSAFAGFYAEVTGCRQDLTILQDLLYINPQVTSPQIWAELSVPIWVRAAGCAWEPDQSPTGVNDWGMVNLKAWSSILLFYNANSMFSSAGKSAVIFLCLSENVNMKMCFSSGRFEALRPLMCPLAKGSLGLSKSGQVVIKWSVKIKQLKYQTATHLTRVSRSICSWLSFQLEKRKEHHHKGGWT